jgi:hypothetical protein
VTEPKKVDASLVSMRDDEDGHLRQRILELGHCLQSLLEFGELLKCRGHLCLIADLGASGRLEPGVDDNEIGPEVLSGEIAKALSIEPTCAKLIGTVMQTKLSRSALE